MYGKKILPTFLRMIFGLALLGALLPGGQKVVRAEAGPNGTIAYALENDVTGDEIHLIEPDGTGDRTIFSTGKSGDAFTRDVDDLTWKPDASELAFISSHEDGCSLYQSDVYAIRPDGSGYRRVTDPPACGSRGNLPTGTVVVPVINDGFSDGPFTVYFEGAQGPVEFSLAPGGEATATFYNVADYGDRKQAAVGMEGEFRSYDLAARADVIPGQTVETGTLFLGSELEHYGFQWPTYTSDGSKISYILNKDMLYQINANTTTLGDPGTKLPNDLTSSADYLTWGPTPARANQFLYVGWNDGDVIYLGDANGSGTGEALVVVDPTRLGKTVLGLAWLSDGSGFLYSVTGMVNYTDVANIYVYSFASKQSTQVTDVNSGFIRRMTVSPDSSQVVFEYQTTGSWYDENPTTDLYLLTFGTGQADMLVQGGRAPAWSPQQIQLPAPITPRVYLPVLDNKHSQ